MAGTKSSRRNLRKSVKSRRVKKSRGGNIFEMFGTRKAGEGDAAAGEGDTNTAAVEGDEEASVTHPVEDVEEVEEPAAGTEESTQGRQWEPGRGCTGGQHTLGSPSPQRGD